MQVEAQKVQGGERVREREMLMCLACLPHMPPRRTSSEMAVFEIIFVELKTVQSSVCPGMPVRPRKS